MGNGWKNNILLFQCPCGCCWYNYQKVEATLNYPDTHKKNKKAEESSEKRSKQSLWRSCSWKNKSAPSTTLNQACLGKEAVKVYIKQFCNWFYFHNVIQFQTNRTFNVEKIQGLVFPFGKWLYCEKCVFSTKQQHTNNAYTILSFITIN